MAAARDTATNPAVLDAFALAILGAEEQPAYPGVAGHEPDAAAARRHAQAIERAAAASCASSRPSPASYVSESDYFERGLAARVLGRELRAAAGGEGGYDPEGLFFVHHGVGSDGWSADGFTRAV